MMAKSGFFEDAKSAHQAGVKIMAGMELGIPPVAAVRGIDIIDGNTSLSSALIAALIKQHPHYDYKVVETTDEQCEIAFYEHGERQGTASYTYEEADSVVAWTDSDGEHSLTEKNNWQNYPSDCLFARAISRGRRRFCPDVGQGKLYTAEELGQDGEPQVVEAEVVEETQASGKASGSGPSPDKTDPSPPSTTSKSKSSPDTSSETTNSASGGQTTRQNGGAEKDPDTDGGNDYDDLPFEAPDDPPPQDVKRFHALGTELYDDWDEKRPELVEWVTDGRSSSSSDLDATELDKLVRGMEDKMSDEADEMIG
jgi:hypothetical protein